MPRGEILPEPEDQGANCQIQSAGIGKTLHDGFPDALERFRTFKKASQKSGISAVTKWRFECRQNGREKTLGMVKRSIITIRCEPARRESGFQTEIPEKRQSMTLAGAIIA